MKSGRWHNHWIIAIASLAASGCAQTGDSFFARRTTVGSLKTGLSHLEFENDQLKSKVAELKSINREVEDRLVQEESAIGELQARLENARSLLSDRGRLDNRSEKITDSSIDPLPPEPPKTLRAGRPSKPKRKTPFARIGGTVEPLPDDEQDAPVDLPASPRKPRPDSDDQSNSSAGDITKWLPISRGVMDGSTLKR